MEPIIISDSQHQAIRDLAAQLTTVAVLTSGRRAIDPEIITGTGLDVNLFLEILRAIDGIPEPGIPCSSDWHIAAYANTIGGIPGSDQLERFRDMVNAIPGWPAYAGFFREYHGYWPADARLHRSDDPPHPKSESLEPNADELRKSAAEFIMQPSRIQYVLNGDTDLRDGFTAKTADWLHEHAQVHILADLDRFTEQELILRFASVPDVLAEVCGYRAKQLQRT